jgi:hypothetical protein
LLKSTEEIMTDMRELTTAEIGSVGGGWGKHIDFKQVVVAKEGGINNIGNLVGHNQENEPFSFAGATFIFND